MDSGSDSGEGRLLCSAHMEFQAKSGTDFGFLNKNLHGNATLTVTAKLI